MNGILEQILAELQKQTAIMLSADPTTQQVGKPNGGGAVAAQPVQPTVVDPFGLAAAPANAEVTEAMVMGLIEPHLDNAPLKAGLQQVLAQMGIARLPEARPDQFASLFNQFQAVIAKFSGPAAGAAPSII